MKGQLDDSRHRVNLTKKRNVIFTERTTISLKDWDTDLSDSDDESVCGGNQQRHVSFAQSHRYHRIISHRDFTAAERKNYWYTDRDMNRMTQEREKVLKRLEKGKPCNEDITYRGLEGWTNEGAERLNEIISSVLAAVMDEQDRQWQTHSDDEGLIAKRSRAATSESGAHAFRLAKEDRSQAISAWQVKKDKEPSKPRRSLFFQKEGSEKGENKFRLLRTDRGLVRTSRAL